MKSTTDNRPFCILDTCFLIWYQLKAMDHVISETNWFDHGSSRFGPTKTRGFHLSQCGGAWFLLCHALEAQGFAAHAKTNWVIEFFNHPENMWKWDILSSQKNTPQTSEKQVVVSKIFYFQPYLGKKIQFDEHIFQMGWLKPPTRKTLGPCFFLHLCCMDVVGNLNHWVKILQLHSISSFQLPSPKETWGNWLGYATNVQGTAVSWKALRDGHGGIGYDYINKNWLQFFETELGYLFLKVSL